MSTNTIQGLENHLPHHLMFLQHTTAHCCFHCSHPSKNCVLFKSETPIMFKNAETIIWRLTIQVNKPVPIISLPKAAEVRTGVAFVTLVAAVSWSTNANKISPSEARNKSRKHKDSCCMTLGWLPLH